MDILFNKRNQTTATADLVKESGTAAFMVDVIEASRKVPVIVDFWAPWCGPCKQLGPALEKLVLAARGAIRMVKINVDENQQLAAQMRIQSIPAVYAFKDGRPIDGFVGALPESQLKAFIQRVLAGGAAPGGDEPTIEEVLAQANEILAEGDVATASTIYREILAEEPGNAIAAAGLLRCMMVAGDLEGAKAMLAGLSPELAKAPEIAQIRGALALAEEAATKAGAATDLRRRLANDPNDHQARLDLAMAYFGAGEREAAVDELLEIVRRDRAWNEDAGRKQLVKLFEAFGHTDPLTVTARRRLSTLLFN
ncbi:MAG: thioredoxin [Alphaproteobacteria bacterium]|nr:thioredoxin [Alphaproteobacteria bacterium]